MITMTQELCNDCGKEVKKSQAQDYLRPILELEPKLPKFIATFKNTVKRLKPDDEVKLASAFKYNIIALKDEINKFEQAINKLG